MASASESGWHRSALRRQRQRPAFILASSAFNSASKFASFSLKKYTARLCSSTMRLNPSALRLASSALRLASSKTSKSSFNLASESALNFLTYANCAFNFARVSSYALATASASVMASAFSKAAFNSASAASALFFPATKPSSCTPDKVETPSWSLRPKRKTGFSSAAPMISFGSLWIWVSVSSASGRAIALLPPARRSEPTRTA
mmetsp:Transcript_654/g.2046  ORF Transcript_654/g.2046 Transcript_654/m.2046 type:complete len:205 (-) Transcript_654:143-757(-)